MTPWTVARKAPLSLLFSRQEYWSGLPLPPPGDLPELGGTKPASLASPALACGFFTTTTWEACTHTHTHTHTYTHAHTHAHILFHHGLSPNIEYSSLCYTVGPCHPFFFLQSTTTCNDILLCLFVYCLLSTGLQNPEGQKLFLSPSIWHGTGQTADPPYLLNEWIDGWIRETRLEARACPLGLWSCLVV